MTTIYTNYWENIRDGVRKEHGSYPTEEAALDGIKAWWEINGNDFSNAEIERTNTGALEISYVDDASFHYRIEKREIEGKLPTKSYKLYPEGQISKNRMKYNLADEEYLFDELAEPYRDRLIIAMADPTVARQYKYEEDGRPIIKLDS